MILNNNNNNRTLYNLHTNIFFSGLMFNVPVFGFGFFLMRYLGLLRTFAASLNLVWFSSCLDSESSAGTDSVPSKFLM